MYSELPNHNKIELEAFVDVVLGAGFALSVFDGYDTWGKPTTERETLLGTLGEMDSDEVRLFDGLTLIGWFWLVYGNAPGELLADYTASATCERIYEAWAAKVGVE